MGCDLYVSEATSYRLSHGGTGPYGQSAGTPTTPTARSSRQSIPWDAQSSRQVVSGARQPSAWHLPEGQPLEGGNTQLCFPFSVLDVNDESPTFFPAIYNVSLPENVARDFKVVRLNCTDADVGLNAELSYFITGMNPFQNPARGVGGGALAVERSRLPQTVSRVFCASALPFPAPPKPWAVSPSAAQPRSAPDLVDRSITNLCPARDEPLSCVG